MILLFMGLTRRCADGSPRWGEFRWYGPGPGTCQGPRLLQVSGKDRLFIGGWMLTGLNYAGWMWTGLNYAGFKNVGLIYAGFKG